MIYNQNKVALTPPMGWNSWNCYGAAVTQEKIKIQADAIVKNGLKEHGFVYINIDDGWQGIRAGKYNAIQGNSRFPDMRSLCNYVHSLGLKIGIYSTPWRKSYGGNTGGYGHELEDARQWAEWGVDFLKYDWRMWAPWEPNEKYIKKMRNALNVVGRKIVFSLSNSAPISKVKIWSKYANMWRTTGDITDTWKSISKIGFSQNKWAKFAGPGYWNDPDMMVVGYVGWGEHQHPSRLNQNEQLTHMTLWCILAAPLLLGCNLVKIDDFLHSILTNNEVLSINQDPLGIQGYRARKERDEEIWVKPLKNKNKAVAFFNKGESSAMVKVSWDDIGVPGNARVRDVWHREDMGLMSNGLSVLVNPHGTRMFIVG